MRVRVRVRVRVRAEAIDAYVEDVHDLRAEVRLGRAREARGGEEEADDAEAAGQHHGERQLVLVGLRLAHLYEREDLGRRLRGATDGGELEHVVQDAREVLGHVL